MKKIVTIAVLAIALIAVAVWLKRPHSDSADIPLRVVYKSNANYLVYFVAREKGFLRSAGFVVSEEEVESTNLMIQALAIDQADFNPSTSVPALYAAEQNTPGTFKFIYITLMEKGKTNDGIIVRRDSSLTSITDLKGKIVASPPGATSLVLLKLIFRSVGLEIDRDLAVREMDPRTQLQALAARQVDAVFAIEPTITLGEEKGISRLLEAESMETHIMNPIPIAGGVIAAKFVGDNPDAVVKLTAAMERAIDFIRANEAESRQIMARAIQMPQGTAARLGVNTYWKLSEVNRNYVQQLADIFTQNGALTRRVDTTEMYANPGR
jgi:ABC-type nitrate/sulfonate/bicarbonate transport system substrate-binding protein